LDNLAHILAGAALGQAGLKRRTGLGMAVLMIAANLPDLDVMALLVGENVAWRRGWTHGPLALLLLPILLTLAMLWFDRWQARRGTRPAARLPVRPGWLLGLAYLGILSHVLMDWLNVYGIRCLMPFSDRWFYGDALFIIDAWLWSALGIGIWLSRRREKRGSGSAERPAQIALLLTIGYTVLMAIGGRMAEQHAESEIIARGLPRPERILASPVPIDPFRRRILFETGESYGFGDFRWAPGPRFTIEPERVPTNMADPAIARAAARDKGVADLLIWSRFPFAEVRRSARGTEVILGDARYHDRPGDGRFSVRAWLPGTAPAPGSPLRHRAAALP
jgi:inner membrane protein